MKKIFSLALALLILCAALTSCADPDIPKGMKSVTLAGEPFILYVPEGFTDNTASGISSAYYASVDNTLMVSARYYTPADSAMDLDGYMAYCADSYVLSLEDFEKTAEVAGDVLGGADARKLTYTMKNGETEYEVTQITAKHKGDFVSLTLYATNEAMTVYENFIKEIKENFKLADKTNVKGDEVVDKKTPEGMKIASSDIVEYRFYVPKSWICFSESELSSAYYPETEKTNVSVTSYSPSSEEKGMSLEDYYKKCMDEYKKTIKGFPEVITVTDGLTVAKKDAKSVEFTAEYDEVTYKIRQVMLYAGQNGLFYTFTYTATEQNYALHMADFDAMLGAFTFR
jgi:hypothetical protein